MTTFERRDRRSTIALTVDEDNGIKVAQGHAAVFGKRSHDLGGFTELVHPTAFNRTVGQADVVGLFNHDDGQLLGRTSSGTLRLNVTDRGLHYEIDMPDTGIGRDVATLMARGDITGSSFAFRTVQDEWTKDADDVVTRTLLEVALIDVSPVTRPAYPDSEAALRSFAGYIGADFAEVRSAQSHGRLSDMLSPQGELIQEPNEDDSPPPAPVVRHRLHTWI